MSEVTPPLVGTNTRRAAAMFALCTAAAVACTDPERVAGPASDDTGAAAEAADAPDSGAEPEETAVGPTDADSDAAVDVPGADTTPDNLEETRDGGDDDTSDSDTDPGPDADPEVGPQDAAQDADPDPPLDPELLFDLEAIADQSTAECVLSNRRTALRDLTLLDVWDVSYRSWEVVDGAPVPIMIRGFLARPAGEAGVLPGVVSMHGLGGHAEEASATGPAALLGTVVLAPTGPGGGGDDPATRSEGTPASQDEGYRIFDTAEDPRGSWLWAHAVAAMRGVTCLETLDGVDDTRLGMTGFSAGGIATLLAASHDPRLVAAVPMSATGGWSAAARAPSSWFNALLSAAGLDTTSPEWAALVASIDPLAHLAASRTNILMINGSTDEFFPLASHQLTMDAIPPGLVTRTSLVGNFDHGCYLLTGGEAAATIEARARLRADGGQRFWFGHFFGTSAAVRRMPSAPEAVAVDAGGLTFVTAVVDEAGYEVNDVRFWWSNNDALFFVSGELEQGGGVWSALLPVPWTPGAIWYVDVEYSTGLIAPLRFSLSTAPQIPAGHVPAPRAITSCLP